MKIGISYWGQLRDMSITSHTFNNFIKDPNNELHILYTTWDNENVTEFKKFFPKCYIKTFKSPDLNPFSTIINNYTLDDSNKHKSITHYVLGLFIKSKSKETIEIFEQTYNIKLDLIVSLRTDTYLYDNHLSTFYNDIYKNKENVVYTATEPKWAIYNQQALPDVIMLGKTSVIKRALLQIYILDKCSLHNTKIFHPETSFHKCLDKMNFTILPVNFRAFPKKLE